jgi:acyl carrier protein
MSRLTLPATPDRPVCPDAGALPAGATIEVRVLGLVADLLGVDAAQLSREVSLVEDLAADSLDLAEIAVAIEAALGVSLPQRTLDGVRTCGELIDGAVACTCKRQRLDASGLPEREVSVHARLTPAGLPSRWTLERVLVLTPYAVETLTADALRAGVGARLELAVAAGASAETLARVRRQFRLLDERGIHLEVRGERLLEQRHPSDAA